ncbi:AAA family ATPase [Mucilaginibacter sp. OK098]|uniref:AAA family ATPase n=1 Tax=Mucilaginibacter sp. OK098 TaxID=1855297 RepID=UPI00090F247A|nr:AAA family ATPase [Mucilaginibacter sp. OK098]SHN10683.1 AAA domain-containing protein [Mucilaginibacter sp. OK098]
MSHPQNVPSTGGQQGINPDVIGQEITRLLQPDAAQPDHGNQLFRLRSATDWMERASKRPIPKMLFGEFWFQGELCILFADSNLGKSILAVQVGDSISRDEQIGPFRLEAGQQSILYFDFELADKQFEARYSSDYKYHYGFSSDFLRAELDPMHTVPKEFPCFEDFLNHQIENLVVSSGATVLIIDNLTYLRSETERAKDALPLMKQLKALKSKFGLSILALAHTPKRDAARPITRNDLQGSKMLMNFCDSAFAIGESAKDKSIRYVKQVKQRNTEEVYGADNVCLFNISKPYNFLQYEFMGYGREWEHLRQPDNEDREALRTQAAELKLQGKSFREIAAEMGITHTKAERLLKEGNG